MNTKMQRGNALATDLYQLTMAAGYFHHGMHERRVSMELFVRRLPPERRFLLVAGLESALLHLEGLRFDDEQVEFLRSVPGLGPALSAELVAYLRDFRFAGEVWAMPEGTIAFGREPLLRVTGTLFETQLVETALLSVFNTETLVASKAARIVLAAKNTTVLEFGTRRTSPDEAISSARAAYLAGFAATSNVEAGRRHGIPLAGTAAHAWTMIHERELDAFRRYAEVFPEHSIVLVDTYDTLQGVRRAVEAVGPRLKGVRLDSGDLGALSLATRRLLDEAGLHSTKIVASGDLNEHRVAELLAAGAPIDAWGIGTELVRSRDVPSLGGVYKLVEDHGTGRKLAKLSDSKATLPGLHQVFRFSTEEGVLERDLIGTAEEQHPGSHPLLQPVMKGGELVEELPSLDSIRDRARRELAALPEELRRLDPLEGPSAFPVHISEDLDALSKDVYRRQMG